MRQQGDRRDLTSYQADKKLPAEHLAEEFGGAGITIYREGAFAKKIDKIALNYGSASATKKRRRMQEARNLLLARESKVTRACVDALATQPPEEQRHFLKILKRTGKLPPRPKTDKGTITVPKMPLVPVAALHKKLRTEDFEEVARLLGAVIAKLEETLHDRAIV